MKQHDILNLEDVKLLVISFYGKVREDETLAIIINDHIGIRWPEHLEKMYRFWRTVLLGEHTYFGAPFPPHTSLQVEHFYFEKWLELFHKTLDELFVGGKAEEAKWRGNRMYEMFELKMEHLRKTGFMKLM